MPRFFVRQNQIEERNNKRVVHITGEDAHHIARALRMAQGEKIEVCDMQSHVYECTLDEFYADKDVFAVIDSEYESDTEPKCNVTLYQALPKSDKMETIIQKSVECGVFKIVPFRSERCVVKIDKKDEAKKLERWGKISESGAKQSGRGIVPEITKILDFKEMVLEAKKSELVIFCYEAEDGTTIKDILRENKQANDISVIVGSEGGFSVSEAEYIKAQGIKSVGLGKRILRCETAPTFALACIMYEKEL